MFEIAWPCPRFFERAEWEPFSTVPNQSQQHLFSEFFKFVQTKNQHFPAMCPEDFKHVCAMLHKCCMVHVVLIGFVWLCHVLSNFLKKHHPGRLAITCLWGESTTSVESMFAWRCQAVMARSGKIHAKIVKKAIIIKPTEDTEGT